MTEPSILYLSEAIVPVTRSVILSEGRQPEVEGSRPALQSVQVKSLDVFIIL